MGDFKPPEARENADSMDSLLNNLINTTILMELVIDSCYLHKPLKIDAVKENMPAWRLKRRLQG